MSIKGLTPSGTQFLVGLPPKEWCCTYSSVASGTLHHSIITIVLRLQAPLMEFQARTEVIL